MPARRGGSSRPPPQPSSCTAKRASPAWAAGPGDVLVDVRYDWGLTNIADSEDEDAEVKNTALQFLIGYAFPL